MEAAMFCIQAMLSHCEHVQQWLMVFPFPWLTAGLWLHHLRNQQWCKDTGVPVIRLHVGLLLAVYTWSFNHEG